MSDDPSFAVPALVAAAASLDVPPAAAWNAPLCAPRADLRTLGEVLSAHALAAAGSFSELRSLGSLAGVERHAYQIETVQRVLRSLRGRALLADEVGLGKTVEALLTLREYQLRGMVRRALVLVPPPLVGQWVSELFSKAG